MRRNNFVFFSTVDMNPLLFVLVPITGIFALSEEMQELANSLHRTCVAATNVAEDLIVGARSGAFSEDETLKCYMKCLLEEMACIDEAGNIDVDATIAVIPDEYQEVGARIITTCGAKTGKNPCDSVFLTNKCWYEQDPKNYYLV